MNQSAASTPSFQRRFLPQMGIMVLVLGGVEALIMVLLEILAKTGFGLTSAQKSIVDASLLASIGPFLLWFVSFRPFLAHADKEARDLHALRVALDAHALVSITDVKGTILAANDRFCAVSGYAREELLGQDHRIVNSGHHPRQYIRAMWRTIARGQTWQGVFCNRAKNGALYWVDSTIVPLLNAAGKPRQYIAIRRDITAFKATEAQLARFKQAMEACSEMILITDPQGLIRYVNPAVSRATGFSPEELEGRSPALLDAPDNTPETLAQLNQALRAGQPWSGRLLSRRKLSVSLAGVDTISPNNLAYWTEVSITPILDADQTLLGYVQIQRDISKEVAQEAIVAMEHQDTQARLAIAEILQSNSPLHDRFLKVLDHLFELQGLDLQRKGGVFLRNEAGCALDLFVLRGTFSEEFIRRERCVAMGACLCGRAAVSGQLLVSDDCFCDPRHEHQFEGMQPHGHYIVPLTHDKEVLGVLVLYTDPYPMRNDTRLATLRQVGELMALAVLKEKANAELKAARDAALETARAKSAFLANMSHEIRTPMNGVLGMLDLLKDTPLTREQREMLETAANSAESLLEILNDILDFSKLEAGKIELETVAFDLPALAEEICTLFAGRAHAKSLELTCFIPATLARRWRGDPTRIRQALTNLIGNAIKFTERGEVSVQVTEQESGLRFEVRDTGIGIDPEAQARLFQPFSQADSSTSRRFGGTGLGLSISKNLIELMGGVIGVESTPGEGTCFWFSLPLARAGDEDPQPQFDLTGRRILVVDDNDTNRAILDHCLTHWGVEVGEAPDGESALAALRAAYTRGCPYELVLLDLHMPGMDGYELSKAMQADPTLRNIPRVLLSSGGVANETERARLGIARSLLKPVRRGSLFDAMAELLTQTGASKASGPPSSPVQLPDYTGKRVLVAEDNKVNQKVVRAMLAKFGIHAEIVENGQQALDRLTQTRYDLVLMDCQMPGLDGYAASRSWREQERLDPKLGHTPIVALTAHAASSERDKCRQAGMDDYLTKPLAREALAAILQRWLGEACAISSSDPEQTEQPASSCPGAPAPLAPWDPVAALAKLDGDEELLGEMMSLFLDEIPTRIGALQSACERNDLTELADAAHAIKGMAGHFCAEIVRDRAMALEGCARSGAAVDYADRTAHLIRATEELADVLRQASAQKAVHD